MIKYKNNLFFKNIKNLNNYYNNIEWTGDQVQK